MRYVYLGDRLTDPALRGQRCDPVRRADGKCVVSRRVGHVRGRSARSSTAPVVTAEGEKGSMTPDIDAYERAAQPFVLRAFTRTDILTLTV